METIGLVAGKSRFPLVLAKAARENKVRVVAVAHIGQTLPELKEEVDELHWVRLGQLGRMIEIFKRAGVKDAVLAGGIAKEVMYHDLRLDFRGLVAMTRLKNRSDDSVMRLVAEEFEREGIIIRPCTIYLSSLLPSKGCLTQRTPTKREMEDISFGWEVAKGIGRLDIGQSIVVKDKAVLAVEAIEGTDACIRRGASFAGKGSVVVKVSKPTQDMRFDVPTIGAETIAVMAECGATTLAIEADKTVVMDKEETIKRADEEGISIVAL